MLPTTLRIGNGHVLIVRLAQVVDLNGATAVLPAGAGGSVRGPAGFDHPAGQPYSLIVV